MANPDQYFNRPEVSNSDLSWLEKQFKPQQIMHDPTEAYKFGTLIDAIITEPNRVDYYTLKVDDVQYNEADFEKAKQMKKAFDADPMLANMAKIANAQSVTIVPDFAIEHDGVAFNLPARCKWDLLFGAWGADIKSTTATTEKQFLDAIYYFQYTRQRAWYMDLIGAKQDMLIGISKVNYKIFKIPINLESDIYKTGKAQYQNLAFKWWTLF